MSTVFDVIYLGNFTDIDPTEGNGVAEFENLLINQTFGSPTDPLADHVLEWTSSNPIGFGSGFPVYNNDDNIQGTRPPGPFSPGGNQAFVTQEDSFGAPQVVHIFDSFAAVRATFTYTDGTSASTTFNSELFVVQSTDGDLYLMPFGISGLPSPLLSLGQIQSIEITSAGSVSGAIRASVPGNPNPFVCFARGALIRTATGERPVETLRVGDSIQTLDHGPQTIRWIGSARRAATGTLAPVLFSEGSIGNHQDLYVSQQHRMLLSGHQVELLFGESEVFAPAISLINGNSIRIVDGGQVEYFHILFDTHEVIYANGALSESFHPGEQGWSALDPAMQEEIQTLFPQLLLFGSKGYGSPARPVLKAYEARLWQPSWTPTVPAPNQRPNAA
ncbi:MAG: Hint domain-containing protein [Pseudomonadota bacterium]